MSEFGKPNPLYKRSTLVYMGLTLYILAIFMYSTFKSKDKSEPVNYSLKEKYIVSQIKSLEAIKKYHSVDSQFDEVKDKLDSFQLDNIQDDFALRFAVLYDYFGLKSKSMELVQTDHNNPALERLIESILHSKAIPAYSDHNLLIHNGFEEEWYRQRLLYKYYQITGDHEKLEELKNQISQSQSKLRILLSIRVMAMIVFVIVGLVFIVLAIRHWKEDRRLVSPISFSGVAHPILDAYGLFVIWFSLAITIDIIVGSAMSIGTKYNLFLLDSTDWLLSLSISHVTASAIIELIVIRLLILKQESINLKDFFRQILPLSTLKVSFRHVILGFQAYAVAVPIIILVSLISNYFIDQNPLESNPIFTLLIDGDSTFTFISVSVMAIVLAPVFEEILFRGLLFRLLQSKWSTELAALVTSVIFGVIHFSLYALFPITALGMVLAWSYQKSNSLITPIVAHALWNATILLSVYLIL
ncbi:MAG: hypothetical protein IEMM0008_1370 [bacterium]|nr:MAG: hypothetical protein IEMM0008_1370 [bacterium]